MKPPGSTLRFLRDSPSSLWLILLTNLWELLGVLFWGWSAFLLAWIYWWENVAVWLITIPRIFLAGGIPRGAWRQQLRERARHCGFFFVHFGLFTVVHGVLVTALWSDYSKAGPAGGTGVPAQDPSSSLPFQDPGWPLVLAIVLLFVGHLYSFVTNTCIRGEYRDTTVKQAMNAPYPRVLAMHFIVLFGAFVLHYTSLPQTVVAVLIPAKICADLTMHAKERERFRRRRRQAGGG